MFIRNPGHFGAFVEMMIGRKSLKPLQDRFENTTVLKILENGKSKGIYGFCQLPDSKVLVFKQGDNDSEDTTLKEEIKQTLEQFSISLSMQLRDGAIIEMSEI